MPVKLNHYWSVIQGKRDIYRKFMLDRFIPKINQLGMHTVAGWTVLIGGYSDIIFETISNDLDCLEKAGHVTNFDKAAGKFSGPLRGHHAFDSDIHKALEGALYSLQHFDNKELASRVESIIDRILAAQQPDGFLISCFIVKDQDKRWKNLRMQHQTYNAGHFFEMAVAHQRLTGDNKVLNAAIKFADHIDGIFGEGKRYDVGGHQEIELALIKLYRVTGERRYLELSKFFLDERGHVHGTERKRFDPNTLPPYPPNVDHLPESERRRALFVAKWSRRSGRMQDHKPLVEQDAVGHAVRAGYTYATTTSTTRSEYSEPLWSSSRPKTALQQR